MQDQCTKMGCCASGTKNVKVEPWPSFQDSFGNQESANRQQKSSTPPNIVKEVDKHHKGTDTSEDGIVPARDDGSMRDPKDGGRIEKTPQTLSETATLVEESEQKKTVYTTVVREAKSTSSVDVNGHATADKTLASSLDHKQNLESSVKNYIETKKSNASGTEDEDLEVEDVEMRDRLPSDVIVVTVEKVHSSASRNEAVDELKDTKDVSGNIRGEARKGAAELKAPENGEIDQHMNLIIADIMSSTIDATLPTLPDLQLSTLETEEQTHTTRDTDTKQSGEDSKTASGDATSVSGFSVSSTSRQAGEKGSENQVHSTVKSNPEILTEHNQSATLAKGSTGEAGEFSAGDPSVQSGSQQSESQLGTTSMKSDMVASLEAQPAGTVAVEQRKSAAESGNSHDANQYSCHTKLDEVNEGDVIGRKLEASGNCVAEENYESHNDQTENFTFYSPEADSPGAHLRQILPSSAMDSTQSQCNDTALDTTVAIRKSGQTEAADKDCESMTTELPHERPAAGHPQESIAVDADTSYDNRNVYVGGYEADGVVQDSESGMEAKETIQVPDRSVGLGAEQQSTLCIGERISDFNKANQDDNEIHIETLKNENQGATFVAHMAEDLQTDRAVWSDGNMKSNGGPVLQEEKAVTPDVPATTLSVMSATNQALSTQYDTNAQFFTNVDVSACPQDQDELPTDIEKSTSHSEVICTQDAHEVADSKNNGRNEAADTLPTLHLTIESGEFFIQGTNSVGVEDFLELEISTASANQEPENFVHDIASAQDTTVVSSATSVKGPEKNSVQDSLADAVLYSQSDKSMCENNEYITINKQNINHAILQNNPAGGEQELQSLHCDSHVDNGIRVDTGTNEQANYTRTSGSYISSIDPYNSSSLPGQNRFEDHPKVVYASVVVHEDIANDKSQDASTNVANISAATPLACSSSSPPGHHFCKDIPLVLQLSDTIHEERTTDGGDTDASATVSKVFTASNACSIPSLPMETLKQQSDPGDIQVIHDNGTTNENPRDASTTVSKVSSVTSDACSASSLPIPENEFPLPLKSQSALIGIGQLDKIVEEHQGGSSVAMMIQCSQSATPIPIELITQYSSLSGMSTQQNNVLHDVASIGSCERQEHSNASINAHKDATVPQKPDCGLTEAGERHHADDDKKLPSQNSISLKSPEVHGRAYMHTPAPVDVSQFPGNMLSTFSTGASIMSSEMEIHADQLLMCNQNLADYATDAFHRKANQEFISEQILALETSEAGQDVDNANKMSPVESLPEKSKSNASCTANMSQTNLADDGKQYNDVVLVVGESYSDVPTSQIVKSTEASFHEIPNKEGAQRYDEAKQILGKQNPKDCHTCREQLREGEGISNAESVQYVAKQGDIDHSAVDCSCRNDEDNLDEPNIAASLSTDSAQVCNTDSSEITPSDFQKYALPEEDRTNNGTTLTGRILEGVTSQSEGEHPCGKDLSEQTRLNSDHKNSEENITEESATETESLVTSALVNASMGLTNKPLNVSTHPDYFDKSKEVMPEAGCRNGKVGIQGSNNAQPVDTCQDIVVEQISDVDRNCISVQNTEEAVVTPIVSPCSQEAGFETQEFSSCHQALHVKGAHAAETDESTTVQNGSSSSLPDGTTSFLDDDMKSISYSKEDTKRVGNITSSKSNVIIFSEDRVETTSPEKDIRQTKSGESTESNEVIPVETDTSRNELRAADSIQQPLSRPSVCLTLVRNDVVTDTRDNGDSKYSCTDPSVKLPVNGRKESQEKIHQGNVTAEDMCVKEALGEEQIPPDVEDADDSVSVTRADTEEIAGKGGAVPEQVVDSSATRALAE